MVLCAVSFCCYSSRYGNVRTDCIQHDGTLLAAFSRRIRAVPEHDNFYYFQQNDILYHCIYPDSCIEGAADTEPAE